MYRPASTPTTPRVEARRAVRTSRCARYCLACHQQFDSAGIEERVCELCKAGEDWADAMAACHGHIAW